MNSVTVCTWNELNELDIVKAVQHSALHDTSYCSVYSQQNECTTQGGVNLFDIHSSTDGSNKASLFRWITDEYIINELNKSSNLTLVWHFQKHVSHHHVSRTLPLVRLTRISWMIAGRFQFADDLSWHTFGNPTLCAMPDGSFQPGLCIAQNEGTKK